jgi:hypothetical protein
MYKVVDDMCCEVVEFGNLKEAKEYALDIQGYVMKDDKIIVNYSW